MHLSGLSALAAAAVVLAACVAPQPSAIHDVAETTAPAPSSGLGSFLAGKIARSERDTSAAADFYAAALAEDPSNQALLERTLFLQLAEGRLAVAEELAARQIADTPQVPLARMPLSAMAFRAGDMASARAHLERSGTVGGEAYTEALLLVWSRLVQPLMLAWARLGEGDADAALAALEALPGGNLFDAFGLYHTALINDVAGRDEAAETAYKAALDSDARNATRLVLAYGALLARQERRDEAQALFADYLRRLPDNAVIAAGYRTLQAGDVLPPPVADPVQGAAEALLGAAGALAREPSSEPSKVYIHLALYLRPDLDDAHMLLAEIRESGEHYADANVAYAQLADGSPYFWESRIRTAANLDRLEQTDTAIAALEAMAGERTDDPSPLIAAADILRARERYTDAVAVYDRAFARIPELRRRHWTLLYSRGIALERSKQWQRAERDFLQALELRPDQPLVLNYLGYSWTEQGVNLDQAREMIEKAVAQRPNDGYVVDSLGWAYFRMGDYDEAVEHLERAVELRPEDPVINEHLGDAYWRVGRQLEAGFQWRRALTLGPAAEQVPFIEAKLSNGLPPAQPRPDNG